MPDFLRSARFAAVLAVAVALVATGVVAGATGGNFILGVANSASSETSLTAGTASNALKVVQTSTGTAARAEAGAGIAGFYLSNGGTGVSGVVNNTNSGHFGVYAEVSSGATGTGSNAALRARGNAMRGIVATSTGSSAIEGTTSSGSGVVGDGAGFAGGVVGAGGTDALAGVIGVDGAASVFGWNQVDNIGVYGLTSVNSWGVIGYAGTASTADSTCEGGTGFFGCAGGLFSGSSNAVLAFGDSNNGSIAAAEDVNCDFSTSPPTSCGSLFAFRARGNVDIDGNLNVTGSTTAPVGLLGVNASNQTLQQGDAVTVLGVAVAPNGQTIVKVGPAAAGDQVLGIVDVAMQKGSATRELAASKMKLTAPDGTKKTVMTTDAQTLRTEGGGRDLHEAGTTVKADHYLRIITSGLYAYQASAAINAKVGNALAVNANGNLAKAGTDVAAAAIAGTYLGKLPDGRTVILVGSR